MRWVTRPDARLSWREWDDGFMAYHGASGQTHYLNLFATFVLQLLAERSATAAEIAAEMRRAASTVEDVPGSERIPELLDQFAELGLISPIPS